MSTNSAEPSGLSAGTRSPVDVGNGDCGGSGFTRSNGVTVYNGAFGSGTPFNSVSPFLRVIPFPPEPSARRHRIRKSALGFWVWPLGFGIWRLGFARWALVACATAVLVLPGLAEAPHIYAIAGARFVTATGDVIDGGTLVIRNGLIEAVGAAVTIPADARTIDGKGLIVYPGLIDMSNQAVVDVPAVPPLQNPRTREETERWKRRLILRPQLHTAGYVKVDAPDLAKLAATGITSTLAAPPGVVVKGQSALINIVAPEDDPQIGAVADERRGLVIIRTPVALHVSLGGRPPGNTYPVSLMGVIGFVRQAFLDAQHYQLEQAHYARHPRGVARPVYDEALETLEPALTGKVPVAFEAGAEREIRRALEMAAEFKLDPIIEGGLEADRVSVELKQAGARVIYSLNYPARPRTLGPDADEPIRELRRRAVAPRVPALLDKAGVPFAFGSAGLRDPKEFLKNAAKAVQAGLPAEAALRALTIDAARIAGVADRLGSIEPGKFANLVVTDSDLFGEKTAIRYVFVDGRMVKIEPEAAPAEGERRSGPTPR